MKKDSYIIKSNKKIAAGVYKMILEGDVSDIKNPGQFVNIEIEGLYLRRPISVCDVSGNELTLIYKDVGAGTHAMADMKEGKSLDILTGLGNGYDLSVCEDKPLLIGGGVGVPPLYWLAKKLREAGKDVSVILGFNKKEEIFYKEEFEEAGCDVSVTTVDGSFGVKGFVTDALPDEYSYVYTCGPLPMLKAVYDKIETDGQFSFEERMGCGFGACMGCSCKTAGGYKRICKDGPVLHKNEIIWKDEK